MDFVWGILFWGSAFVTGLIIASQIFGWIL
jgi:hypothetical protein